MSNAKKNNVQANRNEDPLTGAPGSHPVGTGVGAAGGGATGAAIGAVVGGPVGGLAGAAIGAVAGGLAGKGVAEGFDPTVEQEYWREAYRERPYYDAVYGFEDYEPAYRFGWESRNRHTGREWDEVEADLATEWPKAGGTSGLKWDNAKEPVRDGWDRVDGNPKSKGGDRRR